MPLIVWWLCCGIQTQHCIVAAGDESSVLALMGNEMLPKYTAIFAVSGNNKHDRAIYFHLPQWMSSNVSMLDQSEIAKLDSNYGYLYTVLCLKFRH